MHFFASSWAKEHRLLHEHQPYMRQWREEAAGFQIVEPGDGAVSSIVTSAINGFGKLGVGVVTLPDRVVDYVGNPRPPEALQDSDLLPRTQRDLRQLIDGIFSEDAVEHPIGTTVASVSRVWNATTSLAIDGVQALGGGHNHNTAA